MKSELRNWIKERIAFLIADGEVPYYLREHARTNNVLPILIDWTGFYGLNPDGEIYFIDTETGNAPILEERFRYKTIALFQGGKKYPELRELIPERPIEAVDCKHCMGKGTIEIEGIDPGILVCYCGGTGWHLNECD